MNRTQGTDKTATSLLRPLGLFVAYFPLFLFALAVFHRR